MKTNFLKNVLKAGLGTKVHFQQPTRNRFPFFTAPGDNQNDLEDRSEGIILEKSETMGDKGSEKEQEIEPSSHLQKPRIWENGEILKESSFTQDSPLSIRKREARANESGLQEIEDKIDIQKLKVKKVQTKDKDRIPTVEVFKQDAIQVPRANKLSSLSSVSKLVGITSPSQGMNENKRMQQSKESTPKKGKIQIPSDITEQEEVDGSSTLVKAVEVIQKPIDQQNLNAHFFTEFFKKSETQIARDTRQNWNSSEQLQTRKTRIADSQKENTRVPSDIAGQESINKSETLVKPIEIIQKQGSQQNLNIHFFSESLNKNKTLTAKIAKEVALITKKLDEHLNNERSKPIKPVFLPKRPPSYNLGGWSNLERNYVR